MVCWVRHLSSHCVFFKYLLPSRLLFHYSFYKDDDRKKEKKTIKPKVCMPKIYNIYNSRKNGLQNHLFGPGKPICKTQIHMLILVGNQNSIINAFSFRGTLEKHHFPMSVMIVTWGQDRRVWKGGTQHNFQKHFSRVISFNGHMLVL